MKKVAAAILLALSGILALLELIQIIDPVGMKMADDLDPFGDPHVPWYHHAAIFLVIIVLTAIGVWLWRAKGEKKVAPR